jgi:predicted nucleic acid-binding protein
LHLVDSNVLSEVTRSAPDARVVRWLEANESSLVVNGMVLGELRLGILRLAPGRRRKKLEAWLDDGPRRIRCLPWDETTAWHWAELVARLTRAGRTMPLMDSFIAATAIANDCVVATRNVGDFAHAGVEVIDPFAT